jgi:RecA-family ATPase
MSPKRHPSEHAELEQAHVPLTDAQFDELKALYLESLASNNGRDEDEDDFREAVERHIFQAKARDQAYRLLRAEREAAIDLPPVGSTLADALKKAPDRIAYTVNDLMIAGGNVLAVGGFKVGKTTLIGNLVKALADGEPFLGVFDTDMHKGRIAYLNYEVSEAQFLTWMRDLDIENPRRVIPLNLRGRRLPFWIPEVRDKFAAWLRANKVRFLVLDPLGRAWRGLVDNENDNANVRDFTDALDELKAAADVPNALITHHTGRKEHEEDAEHGRGATTPGI